MAKLSSCKWQVAPSSGQICNQFKWCQVMVKFRTDPSGEFWTNTSGAAYNWPNLEPMQVAFYLDGEITQVKRVNTLGPLCLWQCLKVILLCFICIIPWKTDITIKNFTSNLLRKVKSSWCCASCYIFCKVRLRPILTKLFCKDYNTMQRLQHTASLTVSLSNHESISCKCISSSSPVHALKRRQSNIQRTGRNLCVCACLMTFSVNSI